MRHRRADAAYLARPVRDAGWSGIAFAAGKRYCVVGAWTSWSSVTRASPTAW
jgi:hypothetical protein